jgi:hypothetical protein
VEDEDQEEWDEIGGDGPCDPNDERMEDDAEFENEDAEDLSEKMIVERSGFGVFIMAMVIVMVVPVVVMPVMVFYRVWVATRGRGRARLLRFRQSPFLQLRYQQGRRGGHFAFWSMGSVHTFGTIGVTVCIIGDFTTVESLHASCTPAECEELDEEDEEDEVIDIAATQGYKKRRQNE